MDADEGECIYCDNLSDPQRMICCDRCQVWYHLRCISNDWDLRIRRDQIRYLREYYCYPCRRANPSLDTKYNSPENFTIDLKSIDRNDDNKYMQASACGKTNINGFIQTASASSSSASSSEGSGGGRKYSTKQQHWMTSLASSNNPSTKPMTEEAIENMHPSLSIGSSPQPSMPEAIRTDNEQQLVQSHFQRQPQQNELLAANGNKSTKATTRHSKKAFKSSREALRSRLKKAMRRKRSLMAD